MSGARLAGHALIEGRRRGARMIDVIVLTMPFLLEGLWMTVKISLITIIWGSSLLTPPALMRRPSSGSVSRFVRNTAKPSIGSTSVPTLTPTSSVS